MNPKSPKLELSPEEFARVRQAKQRSENNKLEPEWAFVGEFGYYFGWGGINAILNNEISFEVANQLIRGARRVKYEQVVDNAIATRTAVVAANSKKGKTIMQKGLSYFIKEANQ